MLTSKKTLIFFFFLTVNSLYQVTILTVSVCRPHVEFGVPGQINSMMLKKFLYCRIPIAEFQALNFLKQFIKNKNTS